MTTDKILELLDAELDECLDDKSGEFVYTAILNKLSYIITDNRENVIRALRIWLLANDRPKTVYVIGLVQELRLYEMKSDMLLLKDKLVMNKPPFCRVGGEPYSEIMKGYYFKRIEDAINVSVARKDVD